VAGNLDGIQSVLDVVAGQGDNVSKNKELSALLKETNKDTLFWGAFLVPQEAVEEASVQNPMLQSLKSVNAVTMNFDYQNKSMLIDIDLKSSDPEKNEQLATALNGIKGIASMSAQEKPEIGELMNKIQVISGDEGVKVSADIPEELIKKIVESNEYIVLKLRKRSLEKQVKSLLLAQHKQQAGGRKPNEKQQQKLNDLNRELDTLNEEFDTIRKYCTKHEKLIELNAQKLMTTPKQYMDIIRICARNVYFTAFKDFRERFNNFRIDHVIFRTIIQAPGRISTDNRKTTVSLYPAITLQPKEKILVGEYLKRISETVSEKFGSRVDFDLFGTDKSTK